MKRRLARLVATWGAEDLVRDAHRYGGGLLASCGLAALLDRPSVAVIAMGALLVYLGVRRP